MDIRCAKQILLTLSEGVNPLTGEVLPPQDSCNQGDVLRAILTVLDELDAEPKTRKVLPANAGKPWSSEEEAQLIEEYDSPLSLKDIAAVHGRTKGAIESKLVGLGIITRSSFVKKQRKSVTHG